MAALATIGATISAGDSISSPADCGTPASMGAAVSFARVRSGTRSLPVSQQADRLFQFIAEMPN